MTRLAVFDCDGTLVDSQANIVAAMALAFADAGLPAPPAAAVRRIVGLNLVEAVAQLGPALDARTHAAIAGDYKRQFQAMRLNGALADEPLFPGIRDAIDGLQRRGWLLGVATGKSDRGLDLILRHHGLRDRFVTLQTADRHPSKPHPSMLHAAMAEAGVAAGDCVMIGDTGFDMAMAAAAGAVPLGVSWGYHAPDELRREGAALVCDDAHRLPELMERL